MGFAIHSSLQFHDLGGPCKLHPVSRGHVGHMYMILSASKNIPRFPCGFCLEIYERTRFVSVVVDDACMYPLGPLAHRSGSDRTKLPSPGIYGRRRWRDADLGFWEMVGCRFRVLGRYLDADLGFRKILGCRSM